MELQCLPETNLKKELDSISLTNSVTPLSKQKHDFGFAHAVIFCRVTALSVEPCQPQQICVSVLKDLCGSVYMAKIWPRFYLHAVALRSHSGTHMGRILSQADHNALLHAFWSHKRISNGPKVNPTPKRSHKNEPRSKRKEGFELRNTENTYSIF